MALTRAQRELAASIEFDEDVCAIAIERTGRTLNRLVVFTDEFDQQLADGLSIAVERQEVERLISELQPELTRRGYRAFWSETYEVNGAIASEEIAILKTTDPYSIMRIRHTNGGNYGVSTEDVVAKLKDWESHCHFEILGAGAHG